MRPTVSLKAAVRFPDVGDAPPPIWTLGRALLPRHKFPSFEKRPQKDEVTARSSASRLATSNALLPASLWQCPTRPTRLTQAAREVTLRPRLTPPPSPPRAPRGPRSPCGPPWTSNAPCCPPCPPVKPRRPASRRGPPLGHRTPWTLPRCNWTSRSSRKRVCSWRSGFRAAEAAEGPCRTAQCNVTQRGATSCLLCGGFLGS